MGIVVEVQRRVDEHKLFTWPLYLASLHARLRCPTCLVVIATEEPVARWAARPITALQPGSTLTPIVIGPSALPRMSPEQVIEHPWLAILSTMIGGRSAGAFELAALALGLLTRLPEHQYTVGYHLILNAVAPEVRRALEDMMHPDNVKLVAELRRENFKEAWDEGLAAGRAAGEAEGRLAVVRSLLRELAELRAGALDEAQRARIAACTDAERMQRAILEVGTAADAAVIHRVLDELGSDVDRGGG